MICNLKLPSSENSAEAELSSIFNFCDYLTKHPTIHPENYNTCNIDLKANLSYNWSLINS